MRRVLLGLAVWMLVAAAPALAVDVTVNFDDPAAVPGQSANTIYQTNPGFIFGGAVENPQGGEFPEYDSCGLIVSTRAVAPSPPNVADLACGGSVEFPNPPVLFGKVTTLTRTSVSVKVGDVNNGNHTMRVSLFDGEGRLIQRGAALPVTASGTTLTASAGQPEVTFFTVEETGSSSTRGVWVDDLTFDTPPIPGKPSFGVVRNDGSGTVRVRQGEVATTDLAIYRINASEGKVDFSVSGVPDGVRASFSDSVNGKTLRLTAAVDAPLTGVTEPVITVTATPQDANTGTVTQKVSVPIRITPAITVLANGIAEPVGLPLCKPITLSYDVAADAGPASFSMTPLPDGVTATVNGTPMASAPAVSGKGSVTLGFNVGKDFAAPVNSTITLTGASAFDGVHFDFRNYRGTTPMTVRPLRPLTNLSPTSGKTPRDLQPGTPITIHSDENCAGGSARLRFGNDRALTTFSGTSTLTANVPRLATPGNVQLVVVDGAGNISPGRANGPFMDVDNYRNTVGFDFKNYKPNLTIDQMVTAFGRDQVYFTPNICGTITFGIIDCKLGTPIPDPWAMTVLAIANATMGGGSGGACFGFSTASQQIRKGTKSLAGLGNPGARNAFQLGEGPPGGINEYINAMQLTQLSEEYLSFYAREAVGNVLTKDSGRLRREVEDYLRRGDNPLLSLRNGGTVDSLHVVVAYNVETDPADPFAYYIDVYDSNLPFYNNPTTVDGQMRDESPADGSFHEQLQNASRIHVRGDGSWQMPSSNFGGRTVENIIVSGFGFPKPHPELISGSGALKNGLTILFGWAASGLTNLRQDGAQVPAPASVTQISSGDRHLFSEPGVLNDDPQTALRATPWMPATQATGNANPVEGFILAQGPGAKYSVDIEGERNGEQTRTVMGDDSLAQLTTETEKGVTDRFSVVPQTDAVGYAPGGKGSAPLEASLMARAGDGSTRTAELQTKTTGSDTVAFDARNNGVVIDHRGPAATVAVKLSATGKNAMPEAVKTKLKLAADAKTTLAPKSWKRLRRSTLTVKAKGRVRHHRLKRVRARGAKVIGVSIKKNKVRAKVRVPKSVVAGTARAALIIRRGRRAIATVAKSAGGPGRRTVTFKLPKKAKRGDRAIVAATTLVADGTTFNSAVSKRQATVRGR